MARIELEGARPMEELRGFCRFERAENSPYTADKLTDDEFNFISGINYAITQMLEVTKNGLTDCQELDDVYKPLAKFKLFIAKMALDYFASCCDGDLKYMITSFIEDREDE